MVGLLCVGLEAWLSMRLKLQNIASHSLKVIQSIILNVLEEQPITGNECKDTDDEKTIDR